MSTVWANLFDGDTRSTLEHDALTAFLQRQRWYAGKARTATRARFVDWAVLDPRSPLFFCIAEVEYETGPADRYFLVLAAATGEAAGQLGQQRTAAILARLPGAPGAVLYDGMTDAAVASHVMDHIRRGGAIAMRSGSLRIEFVEGINPFPPDEGALPIKIPSVEQSNSTVLVGDRYLLKVFRRLEPGENPDIEIGRALAGRAEQARVPALFAWVEYQGGGASPTSIALVQQQVPTRGSAWQRALDEVERYCGRVIIERRTRVERGAPSAQQVAEVIGPYRATIERLGRRTADLHRTLATIDGEGFGVHPFSRDDLERLAKHLASHAGRALDLARARRDALPPETGERLDLLLQQAARIQSAFDEVLTLDDAGQRIRTHGDFHLGQVLEVEGDFYFIDFEGEPTRPIAERRQPQSPLRDVAGMLRSFGYAAHAGLRSFLETDPGARDVLEPWIAAWENAAASAYLKGYFDGIGNSGLLPPGHGRDVMLRVLLLDKACYELSYELNNRPDWVGIPIEGILRLLTPPGSGAHAISG